MWICFVLGILYEHPKTEPDSPASPAANGDDFYPITFSPDTKQSPPLNSSSHDALGPKHITFRQRRNYSEVCMSSSPTRFFFHSFISVCSIAGCDYVGAYKPNEHLHSHYVIYAHVIADHSSVTEITLSVHYNKCWCTSMHKRRPAKINQVYHPARVHRALHITHCRVYLSGYRSDEEWFHTALEAVLK